MKRYIILSLLLFTMLFSSFAKKDINAWKNEKSLEEQYNVFKANLNYWNGNYFLNENQLSELYKAYTDSVRVLENEISDKVNKVNELQDELNSTNQQLEKTKTDLNISIKNQNAIAVFGLNIEKSIYTLIMSLIVLGLLVVLGLVYMLYKRCNKVTVQAKQDYNELKEEFEVHKKNALERYTKINMELHQTRMELNKKNF